MYLSSRTAVNNFTRRFTVVLLLIALLLPVIYFGGERQTSAQTALPSAGLNVPLAAPPEAFIASSNSLSNNLLMPLAAVNQSVSDGLRSITDFFITPPLPEGLTTAKVPTVRERLGNNLAFLSAPLSAFLSVKSASSLSAAPLVLPAGTTRFDFDGDGKADVSRFQPINRQWKIKNSSGGSLATSTLGTNNSIIAPADYDGDGRTDTAVFNVYSADWTIKNSSNGQTQTVPAFGLNGDKVVSGDYDGDGKADAALWRPSSGTWYVRRSSDNQVTATVFGQAGDVSVPGNYDGDNKMDYAVFRPSNGVWYVLNSSDYSVSSLQWGLGSDTPVPADYDGDGKTDRAVYRPSNGTWYAYKSSTNNGAYSAKTWGNYGDQPAPADYDGDGRDDFAVWRPTTGVWFIANSSHETNSNFPEYSYHQLGAAGDVAAPSAYLKQSGGLVAASQLSKARLAPKNSTGGTDLYSRNFSWGTGLVGLPGRAGLDAGFGISYNSLVWTRVDTAPNATVVFDADNSNVAPGFRFGFPVIEPSYLDPNTGNFAYLMVTPSGGRVEFRQNAASGLYETADSSYAQLTVSKPRTGANQSSEDLTLTLTTTDGTQTKYVWQAGAYRCAEIKDRNGNYISVVHDQYGLLRTVTDTLGRVITVNYDTGFYPTTITQNWQSNNGAGANVTHTYAAFTYENITVGTNFAANVNAIGPAVGTQLKVLKQIIYPSGGATRFDYNAYGQIWRVNNYAADNHLLNYTGVNLDNAALTNLPPPTDCPRFSQTRSVIENFNNNQETVVNNTFNTNVTYTGGGEPLGATDVVEVWMDNAPHDVRSKAWYFTAGNWAEGLPLGTEDIANGSRKRWTRTVWTQDDPTKSYQINPRVTESRVGDEANTKKTKIEYLLESGSPTVSRFGLVSEVRSYDANQTTVLKKAVTEYNLDQTYLDRRIIGLPAESRLYEGESLLQSKTTYAYDEGVFSDANLQQNIAPVQHDNTNYGASFTVGRGSATSVTRHDVTGQTAPITSSVKYNTAGAAVARISPGTTIGTTREVKISYADSFNDNINNRNTFAYPTKLTDPANNFSEVKYRFDIGANVWAKSPAPAGNTNGKETVRLYDSLGRLQKETLVNTGAYTRYEYPLSQIQSKVYATIVDLNNNGADTADEVSSESWADGAGRVRKSRTELPNSAGGWSGSLVEYNILGQVTRSTVPTEINANYEPAGDDATRGWLWTSQEYDWKGRATREINTDGTDRLMNYEGCGCAGGQVTTIKSETVPVPNQSYTARRTQKIYADTQGRTYKTEVMNWDGTTPYTTTVQTFNGRDQVTNTRQYAGAAGSQTFQDVTISYDGHGRLKTRHYPIEDVNTNTTWIYNADDSIQQVIDPRNVITNYTYSDPRGLLTNIAYQTPNGSSIPPTPAASFVYDNLGNRTQMTDGTGTTVYGYNSVSQMTAETKTFTGLAGNFTIAYGYSLGGGLKSYTDPFNSTVNYTNDKTGRLTAVSGTAFGDNPSGSYADGIQYRAFGAIKQMTYKTNDHALVSMQYDNRLRVSQHAVATALATGGYLKKAGFTYFADSRPQTMDNQVHAEFARAFSYDFAGRLTANSFSGGGAGAAYTQTIAYDAFSQMTQRNTSHWGMNNNFTANFTGGRKQPVGNEVPVYDAAGNLLDSGARTGGRRHTTAFDAGNRASGYTSIDNRRIGQQATATMETIVTDGLDGDGRAVKRTEAQRRLYLNPPAPPVTTVTYQVWSSVLQSNVTELKEDGTKEKTKVFAGGAVIAEQVQTAFGERVEWIHADPVTGSSHRVTKSGAPEDYDDRRIELEPLGQEVQPHNPPVEPEGSLNVSIRTADEPEWLCAAHMNLENVPLHCTIAEIENNHLLTAMFVEYNPQRVTETDSPMPDFDSSPADEMMSYALSSSSKQDKDKKKPRNKRPKKQPKAENVVAVVQSERALPDLIDINSASASQYVSAIEGFLNFIDGRVSYLGMNDDQISDIRTRLFVAVVHKPCVDAYKAFPGIKATPAQVIRDRGITFVNHSVLGDAGIESSLGIAEPGKVRLELLARTSPASTKTPMDIPGGYEKKPNQRIIMRIDFNNKLSNLDEDEFHELVHAGGVPGDTVVPRMQGGHDLSKYQGLTYLGSPPLAYDKLLEACNPNK